jgi:hypothetical protein
MAVNNTSTATLELSLLLGVGFPLVVAALAVMVHMCALSRNNPPPILHYAWYICTQAVNTSHQIQQTIELLSEPACIHILVHTREMVLSFATTLPPLFNTRIQNTHRLGERIRHTHAISRSSRALNDVEPTVSASFVNRGASTSSYELVSSEVEDKAHYFLVGTTRCFCVGPWLSRTRTYLGDSMTPLSSPTANSNAASSNSKVIC